MSPEWFLFAVVMEVIFVGIFFGGTYLVYRAEQNQPTKANLTNRAVAATLHERATRADREANINRTAA